MVGVVELHHTMAHVNGGWRVEGMRDAAALVQLARSWTVGS